MSRIVDELKSFSGAHWPAMLMAGIFVVLGVIYSTINPIFEALDEVWHYPFVWHLGQTWELPVQDPANVQLWRQEASQPPLYYALAALLTAPISSDDLPGLIYRNPHADLGLVTADGNINMIVHTDKEAWPWRGAVLAVHVVRLISVLISTGTVLTVYAIAAALWPKRLTYALLAASFVAFNPMFLFVSGSVNNDNLITLLAALTIWQLTRLAIRNQAPSLGQLVSLGLLVGLASLAKLSGLGLLALVGLTLLWGGWRQRAWRTPVLGSTIVVLVAGLIAGWWYWRNIILYGDWSGTQNMVDMMGPRLVRPTFDQLLAEIPGLMQSFWGLFGGLSVPMPSPLYWILNLLLVVGLGGLVVAVVRGRTERLPPRLGPVWPIFVAWLVLIMIGLVQWTLRTPASQGRLLFPALPALACLWAAGWLALLPLRWQLLPAAGLFVLAVWVPWAVIAPAYARPKSLTELPPWSEPVAVTFGDSIQLLAVEGATASNIKPGEALPLTLYWRGDEPIATDYSVFIHLIDENELIVAQRDVFHGLGLYPSSQWQVGEQFGDTYTLHVPRTTMAPAKVRFGVGLYDQTTGQRLPISTGGDTLYLGQVTIQPQAGQVPNPQELVFEDGIKLIGYSVDRQRVARGDSLRLTQYWQSYDTPADDYKVFVHLVADRDTRAAQHDSEPRSGTAPTSGWTTGQTIIDEHPLTINADAPPGAYQLMVGLYDGDTGERLRLLQNGQTPVQLDSIELTGVRVVAP